MITKENFRIESNYLTFTPSTAKTHADFTHVCSRDRRFHKWTCAKVRNLLIKELNNNNITEDQVNRDVVKSFLKNGLVNDYLEANCAWWQKAEYRNAKTSEERTAVFNKFKEMGIA